jgi:hypothetical protein
MPNPSASGLRVFDYAIRVYVPEAQAVQVAPGLLSVRTPVMTTAMGAGSSTQQTRYGGLHGCSSP